MFVIAFCESLVSLIGTFPNREAAKQYLEERGWHRGQTRGWGRRTTKTNGMYEYETADVYEIYPPTK